jgi:hypothetical protein
MVIKFMFLGAKRVEFSCNHFGISDRLIIYNSSICLSRDRSIAPSKLRSPKSTILSLSPDEASHIFFGERLSRKSYNVVVFPFDFYIAVQQPLKPLWSRLLLCDHEPSQPSTVLCFKSLLMNCFFF